MRLCQTHGSDHDAFNKMKEKNNIAILGVRRLRIPNELLFTLDFYCFVFVSINDISFQSTKLRHATRRFMSENLFVTIET